MTYDEMRRRHQERLARVDADIEAADKRMATHTPTPPASAPPPAWLAELAAARQRIAELEAVLSYIDAHAPLADATCNEPGITLSEAARRAIKEAQP